jgi:NAD(P)H-dependent flavin oxidoreductase YrpB (nitropropane dioxygenase family)
MGVGVSGWRLARAVSLAGQLGVVSGVGLDTLTARRLQLGDPGAHIRRALTSFPYPEVAAHILHRYFVAGGIGPEEPFRILPQVTLRPSSRSTDLVVAANYVEVFLAKEGHEGLVGVNYLEKLQMSTPAAAYGAILAGVDYVLVGAGIPTQLPDLLGALAAGRAGEVSVDVIGGSGNGNGTYTSGVLPRPRPGSHPQLQRPKFLAIVASHVLASFLARDPRTRPDGFVVEGPLAGGHSAPPRGPLTLDDDGQPVYGPRDRADLEKMAALSLPYWLAGAYASPKLLTEALDVGAAGIQVGSAFALCDESNLAQPLKQALIRQATTGGMHVRADPLASPTGFPFKVADLPGTVSDQRVYAARERVCDAGYLRTPYVTQTGGVGYRCPAEPVAKYIEKGGKPEDTDGRRCLCNGLISAIGLGQRRAGGAVEPPIVTIGQDLSFLRNFVRDQDSYTAADVVGYLLGDAITAGRTNVGGPAARSGRLH